MKKWFFSGLLLAFTAVFGWTQTATDSLAADHPENSLLWEISGKDLSTPSYLYGTIHMIDKDDFFLKNLFFDKLAGGPQLRRQIVAGKTEAEIRETWQEGLEAFREVRQKYLLYNSD